MKKTLGKSLILLSSSLMTIGALSACSGKQNDEHTLNIVCLNLGYGRDWIDSLVAEWEEANPGYKVNLQAEANANATIQSNLYSNDNIDDLYIGNNKAWKKYALEGLLLPLDDLLEQEVDGKKIVDKVNTEYKKSIYYNGHTYRLPWTSGVPGIYYNSKMFEQYGWSVPTTYSELVTLCDTIRTAKKPVQGAKNAAIKPFCFTGENMDYFDYATFTWWAQLAGKENVDNYLKYESAATFSESNPAFKALGKALNMWWDIFKSHPNKDDDNFVDGSMGWSNHVAQQSFYNGYSAMMINCDWLYNETLGYTDNKTFRDGFELRIMKTPVADDAVDPKASYIVGEDQYFAVPASTIKPDLAKSFIKLMVSDKGIKTFAEKAHGTLAYNSTTEIETEDKYTNSLLEYMSNATTRFTNWSNSTLFLNNVIDIWTENRLAPYARIYQSESATPVADYLAMISKNATDSWDTWVKNAGKKTA